MSKRKTLDNDEIHIVTVQHNLDDYKCRDGSWSHVDTPRLFSSKELADAYVAKIMEDFVAEHYDYAAETSDESDLTLEEKFEKCNEGEFVSTLMDISVAVETIDLDF